MPGGRPDRRWCPWPGLAAYDVADAALFAGGSGWSPNSWHGLRRSSLVALVGGSGSGKSSVVRAGLLPALAAGVLPAARAGDSW